MNEGKIFYVGGKITSEKEALLSVTDLGLLRGYAIFEYVRVYQKLPFHLEDHLERLKESACLAALSLPLPLSEISKLLYQMIDLAPYEEMQIRILVTGGTSEDDFFPTSSPELIVIVAPFDPISPSLYDKGISLATTHYERPLPQCKSTQYLPMIIALKQKKEQGADDLLLIGSKREILEASRANFFAFQGKKLLTAASGILKGVTRKVVLELASHYFSIEKREISIEEIPSFSSAFITSSSKEILPVANIDDRVIEGGPRDPQLSFLMEKLQEYKQQLFSSSLQEASRK